MDHLSERARTHDEAEELIREYRLFAAPPRFAVGAHNWKTDPRGNPTWAFESQLELIDFSRAADGFSELHIVDRYRIREPFDIEFNDHGFVVWSASELLIAKTTEVGQRSPQLLAPQGGDVRYGATADGTVGGDSTHEPFVPPPPGLADDIDSGAPITGLLDFDQFPLTAHGWHGAAIDLRPPPVILEIW